MAFIVTAGEILAEILAETRGEGFLEPQPFLAPFPSGAPAIFIDQVGKLGFPCGIIGAVGDDDFGTLNRERLRQDGVDVSAVTVIPGGATGTAFVRYRPNGDRDFIFNIKDSASGQISLGTEAMALLDKASHFHVMGSSVFSPAIKQLMKEAVAKAKASGATISFDPNVRKELLSDQDTVQFFNWVLERTDIFMPSGDEIFMFVEADNITDAATRLVERGVSLVVVKNGAEGATAFEHENQVHSPAIPTDEVDPTGAGDCFGATFVTCHLLGKDLVTCLRYANAAGSRQITRRGPMEGTSSFAELDAWISQSELNA